MDQGSTRKRSAVHNFAPTVTKFCVMWEGQALPHDTKFGNSRCEIVGRRVIFIWSLIHGSSWSGLIKVGPGLTVPTEYNSFWTTDLVYMTWWRHEMETFPALLVLCAGNSLVTDEFHSQRPVTRNFDVFFDLCMNKWLSKQSWGWCFETPSRSLWRHCNGNWIFLLLRFLTSREVSAPGPSFKILDKTSYHWTLWCQIYIRS